MNTEKRYNNLEAPKNKGRRVFMKQAVAASFYFIIPFKSIGMTKPEGIIISKSKYSVKETIDRLQIALEKNSATVYARINQQQELQKAGKFILPLEFLLFGNPKAGGQVMIENPIAALDLPLKVIAWQDEQQRVYIAYNDASYLRMRYSLTGKVAEPLNIDQLISKILL